MATDGVDVGATVGTGNAMALEQCRSWCWVAAAAVSRRWQPRRPASALVVSSNALSYAIVLAAGTIAPLDQFAKAPCALPSTSSRGAGARTDVPIRAPSANIAWVTVRRRGQPHSRSGNVSGSGAYAPQRMAQTIATRAALLLHRVGRTVAAYGSIPVLPDRLRTDRRCFDRLGEAVESHFLSFWRHFADYIFYY